MGGRRWLCAIGAVLLAVCLLASCKHAPVPPEESPAEQSPAPAETESTSEEPAPEDVEELPPPEAIVLLYTDYLTVRAVQDGLEYQYTYCFDEEQRVFNTVALIRFPTEEAAEREYNWLRRRSYPNLQLEGTSLSFCFPRKECPFYGISYRSLEILLEETVYEIVERHPPMPSEGSAESGET